MVTKDKKEKLNFQMNQIYDDKYKNEYAKINRVAWKTGFRDGVEFKESKLQADHEALIKKCMAHIEANQIMKCYELLEEARR